MNFIKDLFNTLADTFHSVIRHRTYGEALEEYIIANNPQGPEDVERLAEEFRLVNQIRKNNSTMI